MSWYDLMLVLHILGVLLLFGAITIELTGVLLLRRAITTDQVGQVGSVMSRLDKIFGPAGGIILLSGLYMTVVRMRNHDSWAWAAVSFVLFIIMAVFGSMSGRRMEHAMKGEMSAAKGKMTPGLQQLARHNPPQANAIFGPFAVVGLVILMVVKPGTAVSVLILAISLVIGFFVYRRVFLEASEARPGHRIAKA